MRNNEAQQGCQYREDPVHVDEDLAGPIVATVDQLQQSLKEAPDCQQEVCDHAMDAEIRLH